MLMQSTSNLRKLSNRITQVEREDAERLNQEYQRLVQGIAQPG
jgi:hypothetical protein